MQAILTWLFAICCSLALPAQDFGLGDPLEQGGADQVAITVRFEPAKARAGEMVRVIVEADVKEGWHIYGAPDTTYPTKLAVTKHGKLQKFGREAVPTGKVHAVGAGLFNFWLEGKVPLSQQLLVPSDAKPGKVEVGGTVTYMACTETTCADPVEGAAWQGTLEIEAGDARDDHVAPKIVFGGARFDGPARPGEVATLKVELEVLDGYHIYGSLDTSALPTTIKITEAGKLKVGDPNVPGGDMHEMPGQEPNFWLMGKIEIEQQIIVPAGTEPGITTIKGRVDFMVCDERSCDPADFREFAAPLIVEKGKVRKGREAPGSAAGGDSGSAAGGDGKGTEGEGVKGEGAAGDKSAGGGSGGEATEQVPVNELETLPWWQFLLAAIGGGLFALAMPCTYPMIPITISFFTKQADARGGNVLPLSLAYGFGIVLIFAGIGLVVALLISIYDVAADQGIADFATNPWLNLIIGIVFLVFALSLFGLIDLKPPQFLMRQASQASAKGGVLGVFLMGLTLVVTSFTCTAPFVGSVLALSASKGAGMVVLGMVVFGLTMAIPFVFLSLVPGRIAAMPKSGMWMNTLKVTLGFVEVAAALKFISNADMSWGWGAMSRELFYLSWMAIFAIAGAYLLGWIKLKGESGEIGPGRLVSALFMLMLATYFGHGAAGNQLTQLVESIAPPYSTPWVATPFHNVSAATKDSGSNAGLNGGANGGHAKGDAHTIVIDDFDTAKERALREGKRIFINFTGDI